MFAETSRRRPVRAATAEFVGAAATPGSGAPCDLPQVAIAGRSNVGKSSLINRLAGQKRLARTSKQPGRTQQINFYLVDKRFLLADLPGYGFARVPDSVRTMWRRLISAYLGRTAQLLGVVLLIDARRGVGPEDFRMIKQLEESGTPALFALTKMDKLSRSKGRRASEDLREALELEPSQMVETSARTGAGVGTLFESIDALVGGRP